MDFKTQKHIVKKYVIMAAIMTSASIVASAQSAIESINNMQLNDAANDQYNAQIRIRQMQQKLREQQANKSSISVMNTVTGGKSRLEHFFQIMDVQLADRLGSFKLFNVVEGKDLKNTLGSTVTETPNASKTVRRKIAVVHVKAGPTLASQYGLSIQDDSEFDLKNTNVLAQFNNAAIDFLLVTTIEDIDENHLDGSTVTRSYADGNSLIRQNGNSSRKMERVSISPQVKKEQTLRVTLRGRIYDAHTGDTIVSDNKTYAGRGSYTAGSSGRNELSMSYLYQAASEDLANWERILVEDNLFPIKVLKINDDMVLLNRGNDSGIQLNTYYGVWSKGDPIKDPDSGEILGREEVRVGEVLIRELQSSSALATVTKNSGIRVGSLLRLKR